MTGAMALGLSLVLVPVARRSALRLGVTDRPGQGKVHEVPTPYLGGVAVIVAVLCSSSIGGWRGDAAAILGAAVLVSLVGLVDDVRTTSPPVRLAVETVAALVAFQAGARVDLFGGVGDVLLTVVWLVVLTNAYNLLDNMDACASSILAVSSAGLVASAVLVDQVLVGTLAAAIVGAAAGFLVYNWHPARIFLGDAGSLFLGFLVSAVTLKLRFPVGQGSSVVAAALVAAPALFDTALVVLSRMRAGRPIYVGGTDHTAHRLVRLGLPTSGVAVVLATITACCGALGLAVGLGALAAWIALVPVTGFGAALLVYFLRAPAAAQGTVRMTAQTTTSAATLR